MAKILITPEEVRGVAAQFKSAGEESHAMVQKLAGTVNTMQQNWAGMTSQKFYADYEHWQQSMNQFVVVLNEINQQLMVIAERFERADSPT
ncbi:MAG TPA: WXG100 family type VII secretion target [Symbiobacteriaceae bacterium]|jgi:WXG100 family type VII secretion target